MRHFCTYFNRGYLLRGLALYRSLLVHHNGPFTLWVLCFDDYTYQTLVALNQPGIRPVALCDFEQGDDALLAAKASRSPVEYFFTCSPSWPLYLLTRHPEIDLITYLDSDLLFFSSLEPIFDELGDQSILIIPHRFSKQFGALEKYGIYNVGLVAFRNDLDGRACLNWWRERCLEWCYDRVEGNRFADQKYLDDWPTRFMHVVVLQHKGANLAPWNWMNYNFRFDHDTLLVDGLPLIFYHFQGMKVFKTWSYDPGAEEYGPMPAAGKWLYPCYLKALREAEQWANLFVTNLDPGYSKLTSRGYGLKRFIKRILMGYVSLRLLPPRRLS